MSNTRNTRPDEKNDNFCNLQVVSIIYIFWVYATLKLCQQKLSLHEHKRLKKGQDHQPLEKARGPSAWFAKDG
jgi:hypothetical protein